MDDSLLNHFTKTESRTQQLTEAISINFLKLKFLSIFSINKKSSFQIKQMFNLRARVNKVLFFS